MIKIGIMGGTFNPPHNGHLLMARTAREQFGLREVWFMPSKHPPHKAEEEIASDEHRKNMVSLAIEGEPSFSLSTLELERDGVTYTSDTLEELARAYPNAYFYFIIGSDSLKSIDTWHEAGKILSTAHILSAPRYPSTLEQDEERGRWLERRFSADIQFIRMNPIRISSQQLRARMRSGESVEGCLPKAEYDYIMEHGLYGMGDEAVGA